jgi:membrane protein implicated in regulation of membrane protease activity
MRTALLVWGCLALLLVSAEVLVPGAFLLWLGVAAAAVFLLLLVVPGLPALAQVVAFLAFAVASIAAYRRFFRAADASTDHPLLNRRAEQLVGRTFELESAIVDGRGRVKVQDAFWTVTGPDLPVGARVRVVAADSMNLVVRPE